LDLTQLCIKEGVFVWKVNLDIYCLDHDGCVLDAGLAAGPHIIIVSSWQLKAALRLKRDNKSSFQGQPA
jgi:hypothetical protein